MKILYLIISCFLLPCLSERCIYYNNKTLNVTIPSNEWKLQQTELHTAVNATFHFTQSSTFNLIRFRPIIVPWNNSCHQWSVVSSTDDPSLRPPTEHPPMSNGSPRLRFANVSYLTRTGVETTNRVPLALWADRSVLVLSIVRMMFPLRGYACPRLEICPVPWGLLTKAAAHTRISKETLCNTVLEEVYAGCFDKLNGAHQVVFPLAHGLAITVDQLGDNPDLYNSGLRIVASVGYSLPAGSYTCPEGLFACLPASTITDKDGAGLQWQQRICLPHGLRCDGVVNCPNNGSDERDCHSPAPVQFDVVPGEESDFDAFLNKYTPEQLSQAGYTKPTKLLNTAHLTMFGIGALVLVVFVILIILALHSFQRRRRCQPSHLDKWPYVHSAEDNYASEVMDAPSTKSSSMLRSSDFRFESVDQPLIDLYKQSPRAPLAQPDDLATPNHVIQQPFLQKSGNSSPHSPTQSDRPSSQSSKSLLMFPSHNLNQSQSAKTLDSSLSHLNHIYNKSHHKSSPFL